MKRTNELAIKDGTAWPAFVVIACIVAGAVILLAGCTQNMGMKTRDNGKFEFSFGTTISFGHVSTAGTGAPESGLTLSLESPFVKAEPAEPIPVVPTPVP